MFKNRDPLGNGRDKLLAVFLGVFGLATFALGLVKLSYDIGSPFRALFANANGNYVIMGNLDKLAAENTAKASRDTDGDGLNDYEEEFVYGTSPFLSDTDSDGKTDKEEVDAEENPLCPTGKTCNTTFIGNTNSTNTTTEVTPTTAQIRALLAEQTNISEETLSKFTDEELTALYEDTIAEVGNPFVKTTTGSTVNANLGFENLNAAEAIKLPGTNTAITSVTQIEQMSPEEVRSFLIALGLSEEDIAGVDSAILKGILVDAINSELAGTNTNTNSATNTNQ